MTRRVRTLLRRVPGLVAVAALAFLLWPVRFGGAAELVVVSGHSMDGTYSQGDLLYARASDDYGIGDVAIYRVPADEPGAGSLVVHRIIDVLPDGTYLFQGDNKDSPDDIRPSRSDLVAKPVLDLGGGPARLLTLAPLLLSLVAGAAVALALWPTHSESVEPACIV